MRDIIFRGKRKDNGEWVEGTNFYIAKNKVESFIENVQIDPETVGQYTGLCDKNGKRIFEGDIVNCKTKLFKMLSFEVEWYQNECHYIIGKEEYGEFRGYPMSDNFEYEIIGNIHDNPELLKESESK